MANILESALPVPAEETKDDTYFHLDRPTGEIHKICMLTGMILERSSRIDDHLANRSVPLAPEFTHGNTKTWVFNEMYSDLICQAIAEGKTITQICLMAGMPSTATLMKWMGAHPDFVLSMKEARRMRAELFADKIADTLDETRDIDKDAVAAERLHTDKLKWLAEKNDPDTYGNRTKISGDADSPVQFIISTGIVRDTPVTLDETKQLTEGDEDE